MLDRCENSNNRHWDNYGGRGISVSKSWHNFKKFYKDMDKRPAGTTIERINNNGNYTASNCRWATRTEQNINTRVSKRWTINGIEYISSVVAAKAIGVNPSVIVRSCNGYMRYGKYHAPKEGCSCRLAY
jgi:hypothetical protein